MQRVPPGEVPDAGGRGDDERAIADYLERLAEQARAAGGALFLLNGNHELMNATLDLRYVTPAGLRAFADLAPAPDADTAGLAEVPAAARGRANAFRPGGAYARKLARYNVIQLVGDTVFVHGGVLEEHARYGVERINLEARCFLANPEALPSQVPESAYSAESPVWTRRLSRDPADCQALERALDALGARRMVVGHTPQMHGITSACAERVWRIDTGMSAYYGGAPQALEIRGDAVRVLGADRASDD